MARVVVIGGGWGGCGAALTASKLGTEVVLIERMDRLLGTGLVGGIMGQNARMTAQFEVDAMGAGDLFQLAWDNALHRNIEIPGCAHSYIYNVLTLEIKVRALLEELGVQILAPARATDVRRRGDRLEAVVLEDGEVVEGDAFVDATGSAGPQGLCTKYGYGCAMCVLRCPTFGARVSIAAKAGVK
ncbi:MAG: FAD-dependent oxidoreductase, partial [Firmicutes bacterium]|nr:FAD-dependent oxidoreductase [Bacillota bacterium]